MITIKKYSSIFLVIFTLFLGYIIVPQKTNAQATCTYAGQCVNNKKCVPAPGGYFAPGPDDCGSAIIGGIEAPEAVAKANMKSAIYGGGTIGILYFFSRLINIGSIIAGLFVMWNFVSAGFTYISSAGNSGATAGIRDKITWSIMGIVVIISAYTIAGIIGLMFFGDPTFILNPKIEGAI